MTVINACNVQIMNAYIGICRETNQIYIFQVLAHLLQNPLEITLFTFPAMRNPSRAVLFISKLATKSLLMLQRSRSQVPQQRPRPTNLTFWNWTAATQVEQKNHRRFDTIINEISVKHVARICYFMYVISAFDWNSITFFHSLLWNFHLHRIWRLECRHWRTTSLGDWMQTLWKQKV